MLGNDRRSTTWSEQIQRTDVKEEKGRRRLSHADKDCVEWYEDGIVCIMIFLQCSMLFVAQVKDSGASPQPQLQLMDSSGACKLNGRGSQSRTFTPYRRNCLLPKSLTILVGE